MPRVSIVLPVSKLSKADVAQLSIVSDSIIARNRELVKASPNLAVALARVISQFVYRLASERYNIDSGKAIFSIELTVEELDAIRSYSANILFNIKAAIRYYRQLLQSGKARSKSSVESRIEALEVWQEIIRQLASVEAKQTG